jgi:hypothetical protein
MEERIINGQRMRCIKRRPSGIDTWVIINEHGNPMQDHGPTGKYYRRLIRRSNLSNISRASGPS